MNIEEIKHKTHSIFKQYGVRRAAVFGSVAKGTDGPKSDIDVLIELREPLGLLTYAKLNYTLEDALQKKVDLVKHTAIKPAFRDSVLENLVYIYDER